LNALSFLSVLFLSVSSWAQFQNPPTQTGGTDSGQSGQNQSGQSQSGQQSQTPINPVRPPVVTNIPPGQVSQDGAQSGVPVIEQDVRTRQYAVPRIQLAPEPDLEFQTFVAASLGEKLPLFGHNLFENFPNTFAVLDRVQVPAEYVIGPGDELLIRAWGQIDVNYQAVVDRSGSIFIPHVGAFSVAGIVYRDLQAYLQKEIGRLYKNFQLSVSMGRLRSVQVFVVGQVRRPGTYTVSSLSTVVDALFASGGISNRGSMRRVELKRNGATVSTVDLYELIVSGNKTQDAVLQSGDVVYVPAVGPLVALAGSINVPAIFELKEKESMANAVAYAGGLSNIVGGGYAVVERIDEHRVRRTDEFPLTPSGFARDLKDGDVVRFLRISPKFDNAVTLRGNVAVPGRYPWHEGMRLSDLIPSRDVLITDEYWKKHNEFAPSSQAIPGTAPGKVSETGLKNDIKRVSAEINWEYAAIQRMKPDDLTSQLLPFNLGKAIGGDEHENLLLQPNDVVTIFAQDDINVPIAQRTKFVHVEGEARDAGVYQVLRGETLRQFVIRIGGLTPDAYLYGAEFTRESAREDQQQRWDAYVNDLEASIARSGSGVGAIDPAEVALARQRAEGQQALVAKLRQIRVTGRIVLELKPTAAGPEALPDLVLEDGDRLLVPFKPATVNVIGSVYNRNSFIYRPGQTVSDYLRLAGGATRDGDKHRTFVLRADGSTVSRQQHNALLAHNFNTLKIMPGDTIVVPELLDRGATFRNIRDWSVVFTQFFLGAAAAKVLFP
jgi:polysaccharide export outer membrane protein